MKVNVPELPDIVVYIEALEQRIQGHTLERVHLASPFLLRTAEPPITSVEGKKVLQLRRVGKRISFGLEQDLWLVLHLMIAGRLHWQEVEQVLQSANHTLKRSLTDPRLFSGIGNAYSDEILFAAQLSPVALTQKLTPGEIQRLFEATRAKLTEWVERLRAESGGRFPEKVTAFREGMAVHGRYQQSCPRCGNKIQRIRYASNETNYCPNCQTAGKLLADRALSRLLRADWPRTADELEGLTRRE